ncbi:IS1 family transposase [Escherichia coli]|uniref:IS1 family transposase n=1 Tax=Escherichia coli TaxID=562 RepID=UPI001E31A84E|nr:IS1 family transposase [Escherichia coli]
MNWRCLPRLHVSNASWQNGMKSLARLGRKSLSFSKSVELHDKVIGHYLNIKHYQ